jgi:hypothetical protein
MDVINQHCIFIPYNIERLHGKPQRTLSHALYGSAIKIDDPYNVLVEMCVNAFESCFVMC